MNYPERLALLHALCLNESRTALEPPPSTALSSYTALPAARYLACYLTVAAIRHTGRDPEQEYRLHFETLSVYQAYALLLYAYLLIPMQQQAEKPNLEEDAILLAKTLFDTLEAEDLAEVIESGLRKFALIGDAQVAPWTHYREDLDKLVLSFVISGTEDEAPFEKEALIPMFGHQLSLLCEAFAD